LERGKVRREGEEKGRDGVKRKGERETEGDRERQKE
jgi:hypothetical protein